MSGSLGVNYFFKLISWLGPADCFKHRREGMVWARDESCLEFQAANNSEELDSHEFE
jgi:hypothetical protein